MWPDKIKIYEGLYCLNFNLKFTTYWLSEQWKINHHEPKFTHKISIHLSGLWWGLNKIIKIKCLA